MRKIFYVLLISIILFNTKLVNVSADEIVSDEYKIIDYDGQQNFSYFIDENNSLYATGNNASGQLGIGIVSNETRINPIKIMENVELVRSGKNGFGIILTLSGDLYAVGDNQFGQLGLGTGFNSDSNTNCVPLPTLIEFNKKNKIIDISCGAAHTLLLSENGQVFSFGSNLTGQLGQNLEANRKVVLGTPTIIDEKYFNNEKVIQIETTEYTSFVLTEEGNVYSFGENDKGLICNGDLDFNKYYLTPTKTNLYNIKKISAKSTTAMALTNDGKVYVWGNNTFGQFGLKDFQETYSAQPLEIKEFYSINQEKLNINIKDIECGGITNFILSSDGGLFAFGSGGNGQVGFDVFDNSLKENPLINGSNVIVPVKVDFYKPINIKEKIDSGDDSYKGLLPVDRNQKIDVKVDRIISSIGSRTFIVDEEGNTWSFGSNADGLASSGNIVNCLVPTRTTLFRVENYDKTIEKKNYLIKPLITLGIVFGLAAFWIIATEVKNYNRYKKFEKDFSK